MSVTISPSLQITEADRFTVSCALNPQGRTDTVTLIKGTDILTRGNGSAEHSTEARETDSGEYMCRVEVSGVVKVDKKPLTVIGEASKEGVRMVS